MICKSCGKQLSDGAKFCNGCGASMTDAAPAPQEKRRMKPFLIVLIILGAVTVFTVACVIGLLVILRIFTASKQPDIMELPSVSQTIEVTEPVWSFPTEATIPDVYPYMEYSSPIFSDSNQRHLTADDMEQLSPVELLLARSEIYARHGVIFANSDLAAYFEHQSWYVPSVVEDAFDKAAFNDQESANVQLIEVYEKIAAGGYAPASDNPYMPYYNSATELLLPKSSTEKLTAQDLAGLNADQLIIVRNQIIALHGYTFSDRELMEYFLQCSWYRPSTAPGRTDLVKGMTSLEYENMDFIYQYEQNPQPAANSGMNLSGLDTSQTYLFETSIYSVMLPAYWKDYAYIRQWDSEDGIPQASFYEAPDYNKHGIGHLFTLKLQPVDDFFDYPQYYELGIISDGTNSYRFIILYPSDVQFNDENRELYSKMSSDSTVRKTLTLKDGYEFVD